jgi:hypothetical protein
MNYQKLAALEVLKQINSPQYSIFAANIDEQR